VSDSGSGDEPTPNPFQGLPIFGDLARMFEQQGAMSWDAARQFALSIATGGAPDANVDPLERIRIEQLARVAELHVANATSLDPAPAGRGLSFVPVNRAAWTQRTLDAYRPLFEVLAGALQSSTPPADAGEAPDPADPLGFMAPLMKMIGPMMLGLTAGSMVGHLARRSFGPYDLPIPRPVPSGRGQAQPDELALVVANLDEFGTEWSLPADDLRLWVCLHQATHHAVLSVPHVRERLDDLLRRYLQGFEPDPGRLEDELGGLDDLDVTGPEAFQKLLGDPEVVLGAIRSPAQEAMLPQLEALVTVIVGYVDHIMDRIGEGLLASYGMITEAVRRRRVEAASSDRFVERLFGLELTQASYDRGIHFVNGIHERAGIAGVARLWRSARELPTPAEVDAPGLWLARIDLPD
jgi:putative hydrolase